MRLQTKLVSAFGVLAAIILAVSLLAYREVSLISAALYEVGSVRLPSIRGLSTMDDALGELDDSMQALSTAAPTAVAGQQQRQLRAWDRFDQGWRLYEPLPQTPEESVLWRAFVPTAQAWREEFAGAAADLGAALTGGDATALAAARRRRLTSLAEASSRTSDGLKELTALNYRVAEAEAQRTVASLADLQRLRTLMLGSTLAGVGIAVLFGLTFSRRLSRRFFNVSDAMGKAVRGERSRIAGQDGDDEIGEMTESLNHLVGEMRANEVQLRLLNDNLPDCMVYQVVREPDGFLHFLQLSAGIERIHGLKAEPVVRDANLLFAQVVPEDRAHLQAAMEKSLSTLGLFEQKARVRRPDGTMRWIHFHSRPRREPGGRVIWDGIELDITAQVRAQRELHRINRALRTISGCNQALLRAGSETELLREICHVIAGSEGYMMAWVGFIEHDSARTVRPVAYSGFESGYLEQADITWADVPNGRGPCGRAVRSGRPAVCRDLLNDPDYAPWRDEALRRGYCSSICLPLRHDGIIFGVLAFYSADNDAFDPDEIRLLEELADGMAFGILTLRAREQHLRSEAEVRRLLAEAEHGRNALLSLLEDQKLTEAARMQSDERFRTAMQHAGVGMALVAVDGRWLEVNPALCRIVGYSREELLTRDFQSVTHPDDIARDRQVVRELIEENREPYATEKRYLHKTGRVVWIQLNVALIRDPAGRPLYFVSQMQDISARREAESSLAATAGRLKVALRVSGLGVWRYNLQTAATEWDEKMFQIFGLTAGTGTPSLELILATITPEDQARVRRSWLALPSCDHTYHIRFRILRQDGQTRQMELHGFVHDDALGRPEWTTGVAADITDIVEAAAESGRLRAQLLQSQKMESLGHMAAGVAHDFNNLLTGINGFVELASTTLPPGHEANDLLAQARRGAISARDLVRRILNFSRSNRDQARVIVNVVEVVRDTNPLIAATLPANISISLAAGCDAAPVVADAGQLQQVLINLCTNAAHAIGPRPGRIVVDIRICDLGSARHPQVPPGCYAGRHVELSVKDNGCGMDEATKRRIFEPFFTTKGTGEGTGLGLAIVHEIVTSHGGGLELESTPGAGTIFRIFLPITRREAAPGRKADPQILVRGHGQRILVVDDEVSVGSVVQLALQRSGYVTEVFTRPTEALARFAGGPADFELLVVDQNMPDLTGPELVERIRSLSPGLPVVMMSGRFESGMSAPAILQAEGVTALKKPFEISDLVVTVKAALDRAGQS